MALPFLPALRSQLLASKGNRAGDLQGMALECRSVRELLVIPETQAHASRGEAEVTPDAERVDGVARRGLIRRDSRSVLVGGLPLLVADHTYLQRHVLTERQHLG